MNQVKITQSLQKQYLAWDEAGGATGAPLTVSTPTAIKYILFFHEPCGTSHETSGWEALSSTLFLV